MAKRMMQRVIKEAHTRDVHNIYTYVRNDNKVTQEEEKVLLVSLLPGCHPRQPEVWLPDDRL